MRAMIKLVIYSSLTLLSLALPLRIYKHSYPIVLMACVGEALCIALIYSSTFILCSNENSCGASWAITAIPALMATMNIGIIWPVLAGYAKQAEKDKERLEAGN